MSNSRYSIIINVTRQGFFHSTRGLKQGDPYPQLYSSWGLKFCLDYSTFFTNIILFQMKVRGPQINHLNFADDVIIFASSDKCSLQLIMQTLSSYETDSDQLINKDKSYFMILSNTPQDSVEMIKEVTGFTQKDCPISYLGCPLYAGRQRIIYYSKLVAKLIKKISRG